ncbi:MAG: NADH dehydrogenase subunit [Bacteroidales bacterium]|nr:NADH dehydrogenase subunit [Bacteroidales bacterium]
MTHKHTIEIQNNGAPVLLKDIPVLEYPEFSHQVKDLLADQNCHCVAYYAIPFEKKLKFLCCIANDLTSKVHAFSHDQKTSGVVLESLSSEIFAMHVYEREIHENYGVQFLHHPWLKPVRFPFARFNRNSTMNNYPFFQIESEELHEVGVGPIHAGVIEPGHFRFICNGENVIHLEIHLGYQHRGIEKLMLDKNNPLQRMILAESIAGDSAVAHGLAHTGLVESLAGIDVPQRLQIERSIALELERIAVHIGDTGALCTDVAYQFGQVVNEALRTTIINTTQLWCGNRFGKGLIRPGGTNYPSDADFIAAMMSTLKDSGQRFADMADRIFSLPSVLSRFDGIGVFTQEQARLTGAVGMAARITGINRDIRKSHPFQYFKNHSFDPTMLTSGDVLARSLLRKLEVKQSIELIKTWAEILMDSMEILPRPQYNYKLQPESFAISLCEGWRGEICHSAITGKDGEIIHYKIKDPSFHNWMALALAVRNQEISDFPVCNKSFNLSYCGNDL